MTKYLDDADWINWRFNGLCDLIHLLYRRDCQVGLAMLASINVDAVIQHLKYLLSITKDIHAKNVIANAIDEWDVYIRICLHALPIGISKSGKYFYLWGRHKYYYYTQNYL